MKLSKLIRELSVARDKVKVDPEVLVNTRPNPDYIDAATYTLDDMIISGTTPVILLICESVVNVKNE